MIVNVAGLVPTVSTSEEVSGTENALFSLTDWVALVLIVGATSLRSLTVTVMVLLVMLAPSLAVTWTT